MPRNQAVQFESPSCKEVETAFLGTRLWLSLSTMEGSKKPWPPQGRHEDGTCAPCVFFPHGCCVKGDECSYCHETHRKPTIPPYRLRKATRDFLKRHVAATLTDIDHHEKWNQSAYRHAFARQLIWHILDAERKRSLVLSLEL
eukprot:s647_g2.t1